MTEQSATRHNAGKPPMQYLLTFSPSVFTEINRLHSALVESKPSSQRVAESWAEFVCGAIAETEKMELEVLLLYSVLRSLRYAESQLGVAPTPETIYGYLTLEDVARVFAFGATKYEKHNWRKGLSVFETLGSAMRHFARCAGSTDPGKVLNEESGLPDLAHFVWNCLAILHMWYDHPEKVDL